MELDLICPRNGMVRLYEGLNSPKTGFMGYSIIRLIHETGKQSHQPLKASNEHYRYCQTKWECFSNDVDKCVNESIVSYAYFMSPMNNLTHHCRHVTNTIIFKQNGNINPTMFTVFC